MNIFKTYAFIAATAVLGLLLMQCKIQNYHLNNDIANMVLSKKKNLEEFDKLMHECEQQKAVSDIESFINEEVVKGLTDDNSTFNLFKFDISGS